METLISCPSCGEAAPAKARFCENCGKKLVDSPPVVPSQMCRCGAGPGERDADGYCAVCGHRFVPSDPRDHLELQMGDRVAAVTDLGRRHKKNEDAFAIGESTESVVIVVCDGVSSASRSEEAAQVAADAARDLLVRQPRSDSMADAILAGHEAACRIPMGDDGKLDPPGATIVAALVQGRQVTLGWAGDSRAYWFGETGALPLTKDHSWLNEVVESGQMSLEDALKHRNAHAITQCIGPLNGGPPEAAFASFVIPGPGRLLLCSDGLWGYALETKDLASLVPDLSPLEASRTLIDFALKQGGRDNVTVAILQFDSIP